MPLFANIRVTVDGEGVREFAVEALKNIDDLSYPFTVIAENLRKFEYGVFASEGAKLLGHQWKPLTESTVEARAKGWGYYRNRGAGAEGPARRILHWRLALRDSLTEKKGADHIEEITKTSLVFGTQVPHAHFHVKSRQFLGLPPDFVRTDVLPPIARWIHGGDPRSGQGQRRTRRIRTGFGKVA